MRQGWVLVILTAAVLAVFGRTVGFPFMRWDDYLHVVENPGLNPPSLASIFSFWVHPFQGLYIPLTYTAWSLVAAASFGLGNHLDGQEMRPALFHLANLACHLLNVFLAFFILRRLLNQVAERAGIATKAGVERAALAGALIFAFHPLQVEDVAWVTGFKDLFFGFFALLCVLRYLKDRSSGKLAVAFGLSVLATLAKPSGVVLPLVLAWVDYTLYEFRPREVVRRFVPWAVLLLPLMVLTKMLQPDYQFTFVPSFLERCLVAGDALSFYFAQLAFPLHLLPEYHRAPVDVLHESAGLPIYLTAALALFPLSACLAWKKSFGVYAAGFGFFVLSLLPVLGFVPFGYQTYSTVADRYLYFPMLGIALAVGGFFLLPLRRLRKMESAGAVLGFFAIACLGVRSGFQVNHWESSQNLSLHTLRHNPESYGAHLNLGIDLKSSDIVSAQREFEIASRLRPNEPGAYINLGAALGVQKKYEEAARMFMRAIALEPDSSSAQLNLARALVFTGQLNESGSHFERAIQLNPRVAYDAHMTAAAALFQHGYFSAAAMHFQQAILVRPHDPDPRNGLGSALAMQGRFQEALVEFNEVLRLDPGNPAARENAAHAERSLLQTHGRSL